MLMNWNLRWSAQLRRSNKNPGGAGGRPRLRGSCRQITGAMTSVCEELIVGPHLDEVPHGLLPVIEVCLPICEQFTFERRRILLVRVP